jgi:hypothetical protein
VIGDVADDDRHAPIGEFDEVVEVAADLGGRAVERPELPPRQLGRFVWKKVLLDVPSQTHLLLVALTRPDLGLLLAHELSDT